MTPVTLCEKERPSSLLGTHTCFQMTIHTLLWLLLILPCAIVFQFFYVAEAIIRVSQWVSLLALTSSLRDRHCYYSYFVEEETEGWKGPPVCFLYTACMWWSWSWLQDLCFWLLCCMCWLKQSVNVNYCHYNLSSCVWATSFTSLSPVDGHLGLF
jgi:hypothetical protein